MTSSTRHSRGGLGSSWQDIVSLSPIGLLTTPMTLGFVGWSRVQSWCFRETFEPSCIQGVPSDEAQHNTTYFYSTSSMRRLFLCVRESSDLPSAGFCMCNTPCTSHQTCGSRCHVCQSSRAGSKQVCGARQLDRDENMFECSFSLFLFVQKVVYPPAFTFRLPIWQVTQAHSTAVTQFY